MNSSPHIVASKGRPGASRCRGVVLIYATLAMVAFCGITSLAVDYGQVQMVKSELQRMADATARGNCELYNVNGSWPSGSNAYASKLDSATYNPLSGISAPTIIASGTGSGYWNTKTNKWMSSNGSNRNPAYRVSLSATVPLTWGAVIGFKSVTVHASATAMTIPATSLNDTVDATANPFLAGMPNGSEASNTNPHNDPDYAGKNGTSQSTPISPQDSGLTISSGQKVTFAAISGTSTNDPSNTSYQPDGENGQNGIVSNIGHNNLTTSESGDYSSTFYNQNGMSDANIPLNAMVGIFLGPNQPDPTATPANLDFSTVASRNFTTLNPAMQQIFFIGDGQTDSGVTQTFVAPAGATRLFLAQWDFYEWSNNVGSRTVQVQIPASVQLVQ